MTSIPVQVPGAAAYATRDDRSVWGPISWGPIMMGAVCAIGLQFIFTVLGIALGTSTGDVSPAADGTSVRTVGVAAGLWWLITGTIALAAGGFVFGRLSGLPRSTPLKLEAAAMWGVVALFGFLVVWSGAGMLSQAASPMGAVSGMSMDGYGMQRGRMGVDMDRGTIGSGTGVTDVLRPGEATTANSTALAEQTRRATRTASWWSVIGLFAGLAASIYGACMGVPGAIRAVNRQA